MRVLFLVLFCQLSMGSTWSQSSSLAGNVTETETGEDVITMEPVLIRAYRVPLIEIDVCFAGGGWTPWSPTSQSTWPNLVVSDKIFPPFYLGSLMGTVRNILSGKRYSAIEIFLKKNGTKIRSTTTDLLGAYHFSNLVPGRYELVIPSTNATPTVTSIIEITGGQKLDKTMVLEEQQGL